MVHQRFGAARSGEQCRGEALSSLLYQPNDGVWLSLLNLVFAETLVAWLLRCRLCSFEPFERGAGSSID